MEEIIDVNESISSGEKKTNKKFVEVEPMKEPKRKIKTESNTESYFDGTFFELLAYNYLMIFLSVFTLGVGAPWGICLYNKYIYSHMVISGKRLKFDATGDTLFVKYFKWAFFNAITFGIYSIWIPTRIKEWEVSYLYFEDEKLITGDSYFTGNVGEYFGIRLLCLLITVVSFGLLSPVAEVIRLRWELNHYVINRKVVVFKGTPGAFFVKKLVWVLLSIITFGIYALFIPLKTLRWETSNTFLAREGEVDTKVYAKAASEKSSGKGMNKGLLFAIIGVFAVAIIIGIVKLVSILGPIDQDYAIQMENIMDNTYNELKNGGSSTAKDSNYKRNAKELNLESINDFIEEGGKAKYENYAYESSDKFAVQLTLRKKTTYCTGNISSNYGVYHVVCRSIKNEIKSRLGFNGNGMLESETKRDYDYEY